MNAVLISFERALEIVLAEARPIARVERVALDDALDRVAAADVRASGDVPPFDRSAMDGYAVIAQDTEGASDTAPARLTQAGTTHAGGSAVGTPLTRGQVVAISTGAPMPAGADAVVMVERTSREGDTVLVREPATSGQHIGRRGNDLKTGSVAVRAGALLTPARVGALAAAGVTSVPVYARPTVALLSTGDELVAPGDPLGPGQIHEVNRHTLAAIVRKHGGVAVIRPLVGDTRAALEDAVAAVGDADLIVFSGGSSVGERDLVRDLLRERARVLFHGIAVRPGKPTAFAWLGDRPVLGMPGNPTSCLSNGYLLLVPFLRKMAHLPPWQPRVVTAPLARAIRSASDRHQFYTVRLTPAGVEPAFKGSGEITSMADADGYIEIPVGTDSLPAGQMVTVTVI